MIVEWLTIAILILAVLFLIELKHRTEKIKIVAVLLIGLLLYFSISGVFSSSHVDLASPRGVIDGVYLYIGWLGHTASSLWDIGTNTVVLVGNAIKVNNDSDEQSAWKWKWG